MRDTFKSFHPPSQEQFDNLWKEAIFIFDTNVLLNLYRYEENTRNQLVNVLEVIKKRIWIPYFVGLEFYSNRIHVIAEERKRFSVLKADIDKSTDSFINKIKAQLRERHSIIKPDTFIEELQNLTSGYTKNLETLKEEQVNITGKDKVLERLENLFNGRIGKKLENQEELNKLQKLAEARYQNKIPPGYKDDIKGKDQNDKVYYDGLVYDKKYGDFFIWDEMKRYFKEKNIKHAIFITDDDKEDWWHKVECEGEKKLGPRLELIDEMYKENLDGFYIYNLDKFLTYANKYLQAGVSTETIDEVKEISASRNIGLSPAMLQHSAFPVRKWLKAMGYEVIRKSALYFIVRKGEKEFSVRVQRISVFYNRERIVNLINKIDENTLIVFVHNEINTMLPFRNLLRELLFKRNISTVVGYYQDSIFIPVYTFNFPK